MSTLGHNDITKYLKAKRRKRIYDEYHYKALVIVSNRSYVNKAEPHCVMSNSQCSHKSVLELEIDHWPKRVVDDYKKRKSGLSWYKAIVEGKEDITKLIAVCDFHHNLKTLVYEDNVKPPQVNEVERKENPPQAILELGAMANEYWAKKKGII